MSLKREALRYLVSGVISAICSWAAMYIVVMAVYHGDSDAIAPAGHVLIGFANWSAGVMAAYILNRTWVFRSDNPVFRELPLFLSARAGTFVIDQILRQVFNLVNINLWAASLIIFVIITILNYIAGKRHVFTSQKKTKL